ncbi:unnamed protein product [Rotaria sp. Silwood2]|nr:unnamed protein product [Rotaria sp. Silwood2]CAF4455073.1 unnamed protein product [Rotaria sp. Silwood2]
MSQSGANLVDLPNEILVIIFKKLDNINVLHSLFSVINERFDSVLEGNHFTNTLNLVSISSTDDDICSLDDSILDRFCINILPKIHHNVKHLTLESMSMGRILCAGTYPNLTSLKLFNFEQAIVLCYCKDESIFRHIFQDQITELILQNNDNNSHERLLKDYTETVYVFILSFFKNLNHLSIIESSITDYPPVSICHSPSTAFSSEILTKLCIDVFTFDDCLYLLDGRLKQLITFIVRIYHIKNFSSITHKTNDALSNLKYFSLTCYRETESYDNRVIPLLRRMTHLEKLTLYLRLKHRSTFVDGTHLHNEILMHKPRLDTFFFYISTEIDIDALVHRLSDNDIQQTFINIDYHETACTVNYFKSKAICHVFSLPFVFDHLENITNKFPSMTFDHVTCLTVTDEIPFNHNFFIRIAKAFPSMKYLCIHNVMSPLCSFGQYKADNIQLYPVIEYPNLTSLDIVYVDNYYIEQFLLDTKTNAPRLTDIEVGYNQLKAVTVNFTRDATRHNCANVKRLIFEKRYSDYPNYPKEFSLYFPSL